MTNRHQSRHNQAPWTPRDIVKADSHSGSHLAAWSWGQGARNSSWGTWGGNLGVTFEDQEPITDGSQVIAHDGYDRVVADRHLTQYTPLGKTVNASQEAFPQAQALARDVFLALHKRLVKLSDIPVTDAYGLNEELVQTLLANEAYQDLHNSTMGDSFLAEQAAANLVGPMIGSLEEGTKERIQRLKTLAEQLKILEARASAMEELQSRQANAELARKHALTEAEIAQLLAQIEALRAGLSEAEKEALKAGLAQGLQAAAEYTERMNSGMQALGGSLGAKNLAYATGQTSGMGRNILSNSEKMALATKLLKNEKLKLVAKLAGRMADIALAVQNQKSAEPTDELNDIRLGHNVGRMVGAEYSYLGDPDLDDVFLYRLATNTLQEYEIIGYTPQGRGPMIVILDNSGSMSGPPEVWSKAVIAALRMIAERERRDFAVIHHDSNVKRVDSFPLGRANPEQMLATIEFFSGGGTNFEPPMLEALKMVRLSKYDRADVIFVTDGLCGINQREQDEWNAARKARGMRAYAVVIGDSSWGLDVMTGLTDHLMQIEDVTTHESESSEVLQTVFSV